MTTTPHYEDETLIAFADGTLDAEATAAMERAIDADPALAARVAALLDARLADIRLRVRHEMAPLIEAPVPPALTASVQAMVEREARAGGSLPAETASPLRGSKTPPQAANQNVSMRWALPIAASLTLIAGAVGYLAATVGEGDLGMDPQVALFSAPGLERALSTVASGEESILGNGAGRFHAIASFYDADAHLCREFELDAPPAGAFVGVACAADEAGAGAEDWRVTFALSAPHGVDGTYVPASSLDVLDSYLTGMSAGAPLSPEAEAEALASLE